MVAGDTARNSDWWETKKEVKVDEVVVPPAPLCENSKTEPQKRPKRQGGGDSQNKTKQNKAKTQGSKQAIQYQKKKKKEKWQVHQVYLLEISHPCALSQTFVSCLLSQATPF